VRSTKDQDLGRLVVPKDNLGGVVGGLPAWVRPSVSHTRFSVLWRDSVAAGDATPLFGDEVKVIDVYQPVEEIGTFGKGIQGEVPPNPDVGDAEGQWVVG
jgi:hypothetical protein